VICIKKTWTHNCSSRGIGIPTDETEKVHAYFKHAWTFCFWSRLFFWKLPIFVRDVQRTLCH